MNKNVFSELCSNLMKKHKVDNWNVSYHNAKNTLGKCIYSTQTLSFSNFFIANCADEQITNTVLHEIAHIIASKLGCKGHGKVWKNVCRKIGCTPRATSSVYCENSVSKMSNVATINGTIITKGCIIVTNNSKKHFVFEGFCARKYKHPFIFSEITSKGKKLYHASEKWLLLHTKIAK